MEEEIDTQVIQQLLQTEFKKMKGRIASERAAGWGKSHNPDRADLARSYTMQEQDITLQIMAQERLNRIEQALERLEDKSYGHCINCGRTIKFERLQVIPTAEYCIRCQEEQE